MSAQVLLKCSDLVGAVRKLPKPTLADFASLADSPFAIQQYILVK